MTKTFVDIIKESSGEKILNKTKTKHGITVGLVHRSTESSTSVFNEPYKKDGYYFWVDGKVRTTYFSNLKIAQEALKKWVEKLNSNNYKDYL